MKIQNKFFFILFSFSLLLVIALAMLMQWSIGKGMTEYVNTKEMHALQPLVKQLAIEYKKHNNWSTIAGKNREFSQIVYSKLEGSRFLQPAPPPPMDHKREELRPAFNTSPEFEKREEEEEPIYKEIPWYSVLDSEGHMLVGHNYNKAGYNHIPIIIAKKTVGFLAIPKIDHIIDGYELDFIEEQESYLVIFTLITMFLVALITLPLARHVLAPIDKITKGMHLLTQGKYEQKISLKRKDELGALIRDFNELALTLDENESARKRWLANISHELRTPVAILRGELEAMLDNVRPLSKENIESSNDEVKHLQFLIDDLHQLTSADLGGMHYRKKTQDMNVWLASEANKYNGYLADAGIKLELDISQDKADVFADFTRLCQLFENIINNCVKYSHANKVKISSSINKSADGNKIIIKIEDDGVGVEEKHLSNLFEYLYRVDNSRNRKTGGTGLGLSICSHIVAAHQGEISAECASLGGLAIIIKFPLI